MAEGFVSNIPKRVSNIAFLLGSLASICGRFWGTLAALLWCGRLPDYKVSAQGCRWQADSWLHAAVSRAKLIGYGLLFSVLWTGQLALHKLTGMASPSVEESSGKTLEVPRFPWLAQHTIKLNGVRLHYVEAGDRSRRLVLFLHGFAEFWYSWRFQLDYLRHRAWVVAIDLPGTGNSDKCRRKAIYSAKFVAELMQHFICWLGKEHCILVGSDTGALIGWQILKTTPRLVTHFICLSQPMPHITSQSLHSSFRRKWKARFLYVFQLPWLPEYILSVQYVNFFKDEYLRVLRSGQFSEEDISAYYFTFSDLEDWFGPITYYRHFFDNDNVQTPSHQLNPPCLLVFGEEDNLIPPSDRFCSLSHLCRGKVEIIRGANRRLNEHHSSDINRYIEQFASLNLREHEMTTTTISDERTKDRRTETRWPGLGTVIYLRARDSFRMACNLLDVYSRSIKYME